MLQSATHRCAGGHDVLAFEASACFRGTVGERRLKQRCSRVAFGPGIAAQPGIVLFDRVVMEAAAAEGCRALETASAADEGEVVEYVQRRLGAVPAVSAFHEGLWDIEVQGAGQSGQCVSVRISHGTGPCRSWGGMGLSGLDGRQRPRSPRGFSRDEHS